MKITLHIARIAFIMATCFHVGISQIKPNYLPVENINQEAQRIGLIIGIDQYKDDLLFRQNTIPALERLSAILYGKYGYQKVFTLFNENASSRNIYRKFDEILKTMGPDDVFFIYIAGHFISQSDKDVKPSPRQTFSYDNRIYFVPYDGLVGESYTLIDLSEFYNLVFRTPADRVFFGISDCVELPKDYYSQFYDAAASHKMEGSYLLSYRCNSSLAKTSLSDTLVKSFVNVLSDPATNGAYSFSTDLVDKMLNKQLGDLYISVSTIKFGEGYNFNLPRNNIDQAIVHNLHETNTASVRMQAIDDLVKFVNGASVNAKPKITEEAAVNYLIPIITNTAEDPQVQVKAIEALPKMEYRRSLAYLEQVLEQNHNYTVQAAAFNAIRLYPSDQSTQYIRRALEYDEPKIRISAIKALAGDSTSLDRIIEHALSDENVDVQIAALSALTQYKNLTMDQQDRLAQLLSVKKSDRLLKESIRMLSKMKLKGITDEIGVILQNSKNPDIKEAAAYALATLGDTSLLVERILVENLKQDTSSKVREASAFALSGYGEKISESQLIATVRDKKEATAVRITSIYALGKRKSEKAIKEMISQFNDENQQVRLAAVEALGDIGNDSSLDALNSLVKDEDYHVREAAQKSISLIISNQERAKKIGYIRQSLSDSLSSVRIDALYSAGDLGDSTITPDIIGLLDDDDFTVRETAVRVLTKFNDPFSLRQLNDTLLSPRQSDRSLLRAQAARVLGNIGNENFVPGLVRALKDKSSTVRSAVVMALGKMEDPSVIDHLLNATNDADVDVRRAAAEAIANQCMRLICSSADIRKIYQLAERTYDSLQINLGIADTWTRWFDVFVTNKKKNDADISMQVITDRRQDTENECISLLDGDAFTCLLKNNSNEEIFISLVDLSGNGKYSVVQSAYVAPNDTASYTLKAFVPKGSDKGMEAFKMFITPTRLDFQQLLDTKLKGNDRRFSDLITSSLKNIYKGPPDVWQTLEAYLEVRPRSLDRKASE